MGDEGNKIPAELMKDMTEVGPYSYEYKGCPHDQITMLGKIRQ